MSTMTSRRVVVRDSIFAVGSLGGSVLLGRWLSTQGSAGPAQRPVAAVEVGAQVVFVYVGSSRCGPSNSPELPSAIHSAMDAVRSEAKRRGLGFASIGVAKEASANAGIAHLAKMAAFDEVAAGQSELNQASQHFLSRDHRGLEATPQIILVHRTVKELPFGGIDTATVEEVVLSRKLGVPEIRSWAEAGAVIPLT